MSNATIDLPTTGTDNGTATDKAPKGTKASRMWAIMGRCQRKAFSIKGDVATEDGTVLTYSLKLDGRPASFSAKGYTKLAEDVGGKLSVKGDVGDASGSGNGVAVGSVAAEAVKEMTGGK